MTALGELDLIFLPSITYTRGLDLSGTMQGAGGIGGLLAMSQHSFVSTQHYYYHSDAGGNVLALTDGQQNIVARYVYDPFGNLISATGSLASANFYRFSGKEQHPLSGLYYYGFRFYEPKLARWMNADPIGFAGGFNQHQLIGNNAVNHVDPLGLYDGNFNRPPEQVTWDLNFHPLFFGSPLSTTAPIQLGTEYNAWPTLEPQEMGLVPDVLMVLIPVPGLEELNVASRVACRGAAKEASSALQGARLGEHLRQLQKYGQAGFKELESGRLRYYGNVDPATTPGPMTGRRLVREWDPSTGATRTWHETVDQAGRARIVRPETGGSKVHYMFDEHGNYTGSF